MNQQGLNSFFELCPCVLLSDGGIGNIPKWLEKKQKTKNWQFIKMVFRESDLSELTTWGKNKGKQEVGKLYIRQLIYICKLG